MAIQEQFEEFYNKIKLTKAQKDDAITKYNGVCKKLHDHFYTNQDYTGSTKLLIGSYGKRTNIRPPRDVDVIFIMPEEIFDKYDKSDSNGQSQLLQDIRAILSKKYTTTDKISGWGKIVLVQFSDDTHNVELLPAWEHEDKQFVIPNTEEGGSWETWDPRSEIKNINNSDDEAKGKTRALIRMTKKWVDNCSVKLKSFKIERTVLKFINPEEHARENYSDLIKDFFDHFKSNSDKDSKSHLTTAFNRAKMACEYEKEGNIDKATQEWKKIYGDDFPSHGEEKTVTPSLQSDPVLGDSSHCKPLPWSFERIYRVNIDAYVYTENKSKRLGGINSDGRNLSLGFRLKFIANTNISGEFKYYWQVVNTGTSARDAGDLRGEILEGEKVKWEHTKYLGKHWIECFIIQNEVCVARSGKFFVKIK